MTAEIITVAFGQDHRCLTHAEHAEMVNALAELEFCAHALRGMLQRGRYTPLSAEMRETFADVRENTRTIAHQTRALLSVDPTTIKQPAN